MSENRFNIRVYGLLFNQQGEVLLSSENRKGFNFTKFPGGGLDWGEGIKDCLYREFEEELGIEVEIESHFYTTDFFQRSAFREADQLISIYYKVNAKEVDLIKSGRIAKDVEVGNTHVFNWVPVQESTMAQLTFPIDQKVLELLLD